MEVMNFIDFLLCSSSDESSDDEIELVRKKRLKIEGYVENVVGNYSESVFRENFRVSRNTFQFITSLIKNDISSPYGARGRMTIDSDTQVLVTLWYLSTPDSYRSICERFNISKGTAWNIVRRVCSSLIQLSNSFIRWRAGDYAGVVQGELEEMGFPSTLGCIDGTYIPIPLPEDNGNAYICRKGFPCIILQAVCDHRLLFTHCYAGEVGSQHDSRVLKRSEVWSYVTEHFPNISHLIGDKAYPCLQRLITPYKDNCHLTVNQRRFNHLHASSRSTIERTFGLLKKRFRILKFMDVRNIEWACKYIIVCCILHNICILQEDINEADIQHNEGNEIDDDDDGYYGNVLEREMRFDGQNKRNIICEQLQ